MLAPVMNQQVWDVWSLDNFKFAQGNEDVVREQVEGLLEKTVGFFVMLESGVEEDDNGVEQLQFYLHTDNYEDLTEEDYQTLVNKHGIVIDDHIENNHKAICKLLNIVVKES